MKRSFVVAAAAASFLAWPVMAQTAPKDRITVVGAGSVTVVPDVAVVQAGVATQAKTAREAADANNKAMAKVLAALKDAGIDDKDIRTSRFNIVTVRDNRPNASPQVLGFRVTNQVSAKIRSADKTSTVLDRVITAGANEIPSIHFTVSEPSRRLDEARQKAVADARHKAELLAKAAGARVGAVLVIDETGGAAVPYPASPRYAAAAAPSVPIAVGEETLHTSVTVTFELLH